MRGWLDGRDVPPQLAIDHELRWLIIRRLAIIGEADDELVTAELERDPTSTGEESAAAARTAMPGADEKATAWEAIFTPDAVSGGILRAIVDSFWHAEQLDVCEPYVDRYLEALPEVWRTRGSDTAWGITTSMFPAVVVSPVTVERVSRALDAELDDALRRLLVEGRADVERALRARAVDRVAQPSQARVTSSA